MFDFYEKRKIRNLVYSRFSIGVLIMLSLLLSLSVFERFTVEREMSAKREVRQSELEVLKERAAVLESKVEHLGDERGIEEELRSRFDVAKEHEQVVIILEDETPTETDLTGLSGPPGGEEDNGTFLDILKFW